MSVYVLDKKRVSSKSVQNPNNPDAEYRGKAGKKVKGYSTNITETATRRTSPA